MPRKRRTSTTSFDDDDFSPSDEKYSKDELEGRAPRNAANARERARMRVLSKAFCRLKTTLPWVPADTKLSKLDTLRLAATYIAHLRAVLQDDGDVHPESARSLSLTLKNNANCCIPGGSNRFIPKAPDASVYVYPGGLNHWSWPFALQSASTPSMFLNNSCSVSSTSGMSNTNQYYHRTHRHDDDEINDVQCYHSESHQNYVNRHHNHESHQMYY